MILGISPQNGEVNFRIYKNKKIVVLYDDYLDFSNQAWNINIPHRRKL